MAKDPSESFFTHYRDEGRTILDAEVWFTNSVIPFPVQPQENEGCLVKPSSGVDQAKVDEATRVWRDSINHPGEGNARFWTYAVTLRATGMDLKQIEIQLRTESVNGRSPAKRRAQIPSIIKSLRGSWRKAG